jgi:hypothetical protein
MKSEMNLSKLCGIIGTHLRIIESLKPENNFMSIISTIE